MLKTGEGRFGRDSPMSNPLHPDLMSAKARIAELGAILAIGLMRLLARKSREKSPESGQISLDFDAGQSGPVTKLGPAESGK